MPTGQYPRTKSNICKKCGEPREIGSPYRLCLKCKKETLKGNTNKHLTKKRERVGDSSYLLARQLNVLKWRGVKLTPEEFYSMLEKQGKCCAICKDAKPGGQGNWHVDHCHATGRIRGLLCTRCNALLGYAKDSILRLQSAIDYLERSL